MRPEILLIDWGTSWDTEPGSDTAQIRFEKVKNFGRGPALHIWFEFKVGGQMTEECAAFCDTIHELPAGDERLMPGRGDFVWKNQPMIPLHLSVYSLDLLGNQYELSFELEAHRSKTHVPGAENLAPGLVLLHRSTHLRSARRQQWASRRRRLLAQIRKSPEKNSIRK